MKINEILNEMGVGGIAMVAAPMGATVRRAPGSPPKKKRKKANEAEHPECTVCNGSGIDRAENACKACDGSGHKLNEAKGKKEPRDPDEIWRDKQHARIPPENRCPACDGMAGTYGLWSAPCRVCQGSGRKDMKGITKITPTSEGKKRKSAFSNVTRDKNAPKAAPNLAAKHASSVTGGGAAGAHASKKDKAGRPDRKQKHKGKSMDEGDAAQKKKGPADSTSRGWEKAAKKNTHKKRRQAGKKEVNEGSVHGFNVSRYYAKHQDQIKITNWLRKEVGLPKDAPVYFDDVDLVYGEKTIVHDALIDPKYKMVDLVNALAKATGNKTQARRKDDRSMEEAKTKKVPHAKARTKAPKPKKVTTSGSSPHPLRGKLVGGS